MLSAGQLARGGAAVIFLVVALAALKPVCAQNSSPSIEAYNRALKQLNAGEREAALRALMAIVVADPAFERAYDKINEIRIPGRADAALEFYQSLLSADEQNYYAYYGLALSQRDRDPARAAQYVASCINKRPAFLPAYALMVELAKQLNRLPEAEEQIAAVLAADANNPAAYFGLSRLYARIDDNHHRQLAMLNRALALDPPSWLPYFDKYQICLNLQDTEMNLALLEQMLRKAQALNDLESLGRIYGRLGQIENITGDYDRALEHLSAAVVAARAIGFRTLEQSCLANLGHTYQYIGNFPVALSQYEAALRIAQEIGEPSTIGRTIGLIADYHAELANYSQAVSHYLEAARFAEKASDSNSQASQFGSIALVYAKLGDYQRALEYIDKGLKLLQPKHAALQGNLLETRGIIYQQLAKHADALADFNAALDFAKTISSRRAQATRLALIGRAQAAQGNSRAAAQALNQAQEVLALITAPKQAEGKVTPTELKASLNVEGLILIGLGDLHLQLKAYDAAQQYYQKALTIGKESSAAEIEWQSQAGLAAVCAATARPAAALAHYQQAIESIEMVRRVLKIDEEKAGFFQDKVEVYKRLLHLLVSQSKSGSDNRAEIFHYMERYRARAFLDLVTGAGTLDQGVAPELIGRQRAVQARVSYIQTEMISELRKPQPSQPRVESLSKLLNQTDEERQNLQREIMRRHPQYGQLQYPQPVRLIELQQQLDDKTVVLEYSLSESGAFLCAVSRNDCRIAAIAPATQINERVQRLREAITKPQRAALANYLVAARGLYEDLILPAGEILTGKQALIIVPDGILHYLPYEVLLKDGGKLSPQGGSAQWPYLIRDYAVSYAPSASVLVRLLAEHKQSEAQKSFLGYGDPSYPESATTAIAVVTRSALEDGKPLQLARLDKSREEITAIARLFPPQQATLFLQRDASEENVKVKHRLADYKIIHFAVHGLLNEARSQFSALVFSLPERPAPAAEKEAGYPEDGLLQVHEIFNLKLNADLVVLSACETGLGKEVKGEGIVGMTRAFIYAGSTSVVTSLWKVSDVSTSQLMVDFYRNLTTGGVNKAEALRQAKLAMIEKSAFHHPYYWAPFVLAGKQ